jgi:CHAD domain-containing protein
MARIKLIPGLECSAPADKMLRIVLRHQLEGMCALRSKALDWKDPEGVHDMRVLTRRLRTAIGDVKPYLAKSGLPRVKLRSIARSLGAVRDEDVALSALRELKSNAEEQVTDGIELLLRERSHKRDQAREALKKVINRDTTKEFRKEFLTALRSISVSSRPDGTLEYGQLGAHIVARRLKELKAASHCIYFPLAIKDIHNLRILTKRLRYAIELFAVCWGAQAVEMAHELSLLQDSLGVLHDCDVWLEKLGTHLVEIERDGPSESGSTDLRRTALWLLTHFNSERVKHYHEALARWHRWQADGFLIDVKSLITAKVMEE